MQYLEVNQEQYDGIQGTNDLDNIAEGVDNLFNRKKAVARKKRRTARRVKRKTRRISRATKKGKTRRVAKLKKRITKTKKRGSKRVKRIQTKGTLAERIALAPLLPLRAMMAATLKKRGVKASKNTPIVELANLFYNKVVHKSNPGHYEEIDLLDYYDDNVAGLAISAVVKGILEFIKGVKKKKEKGEPLNKVEQTVATGTEIAETKAKESAQEEAASQVGKKLLFDKKTQMIIGGVVVMVIIIAVVLARAKK